MAYTYLRVGTKPFRSKPPRKGPPCTEPYVRGSNILRDPGFEQHVGWSGRTEIPEGFKWQDGSDAPMNLLGWDNTTYFSGDPWTIGSTSPRSGTYHVLMDRNSAGASPSLEVVGLVTCDAAPKLYAARVEPGDFVRFGAYWKTDNTTPDPIFSQFYLDFHQADHSSAGSVLTEDIDIPGTYTWIEQSAVAPAGSYFLRVYLTVSYLASFAAFEVHGDDAVLEVR